MSSNLAPPLRTHRVGPGPPWPSLSLRCAPHLGLKRLGSPRAVTADGVVVTGDADGEVESLGTAEGSDDDWPQADMVSNAAEHARASAVLERAEGTPRL